VLAEHLQLDTLVAVVLPGIQALSAAFTTQLQSKALDEDLAQLRPATLIEVMRCTCSASRSTRCPHCGERIAWTV
jgi:hypothetical protein